MSSMISEETVQTIQRGLSDWWSEETEYVYQRIERWAAFARGYNRLRSQRYSRGRLTMTINENDRESGSLNILKSSSSKSVSEENNRISSSLSSSSLNHRSENINKRSEKRIKKCRNDFNDKNKDKFKDNNRCELSRINCCGNLINYQSNKYVDNNCLESYRYDHSIYFKTIGDIRGFRNRNDKKFQNSEKDFNNVLVSEINCADYNKDSIENYCRNVIKDDRFNKKKSFDLVNDSKDSGNLNINYCSIDDKKSDIVIDEEEKEEEEEEEDDKNKKDILNNDDDDDDDDDGDDNISKYTIVNFDNNNIDDKNNETLNYYDRNRERRIVDKIDTNNKLITNNLFRSKQSTRIVSQPTISGNNNIIWPGVLLNYKKNVHPINSPHNHTINK